MVKKTRFWVVATEPFKRLEKFPSLKEATDRAMRLGKDFDEVFIFELKQVLVTEYKNVEAEVVDEGEIVVGDIEKFNHDNEQEDENFYAPPENDEGAVEGIGAVEQAIRQAPAPRGAYVRR